MSKPLHSAETLRGDVTTSDHVSRAGCANGRAKDVNGERRGVPAHGHVD